MTSTSHLDKSSKRELEDQIEDDSSVFHTIPGWEMRSIMLQLHKILPGSELNKFPAPQPVSMSNKHLLLIKSMSYWVCEKSDGDTSCLFVLNENVYMMDRKCRIKICTSKKYTESFKSCLGKNNTVVVGEWIHEDSSLRLFDVLLYDGELFIQTGIDIRLKTLWMIVSKISPTVHLPFTIRIKRIVALKYLQTQVMAYIKKETMTKENSLPYCEYQYDDGKRRNKNDGLVFIPEKADYFCSNKQNGLLLKWKWPDMNSVDFAAVYPWFDKFGSLVLYSACQTIAIQQSSIHTTTQLPPTQEFRLVVAKKVRLDDHDRRIFESMKNSNSNTCIVEMTYLTKQSQWKMVRIRKDKPIPNILETTISTMETIADSVSIEDITLAHQVYLNKIDKI